MSDMSDNAIDGKEGRIRTEMELYLSSYRSGRRLEDTGLFPLYTIVQGIHELHLNVVRLEWMMEVSVAWLHCG